MRRSLALLVLGCLPIARAAAAPPEPPPWAGSPVARKDVPRVYLDEWMKAENKKTCPPLVATDLGDGAGARARRANFYGGWAVAYDKKGLPGTAPSGDSCATCGRGAFGVAGAGTGKDVQAAWDHELHWADGSRAGYGPQPGGGAIADLAVEGADCLYQVWSYLGEEHLLRLLNGLRRVSR